MEGEMQINLIYFSKSYSAKQINDRFPKTKERKEGKT